MEAATLKKIFGLHAELSYLCHRNFFIKNTDYGAPY
jgi:hypothetical protein